MCVPSFEEAPESWRLLSNICSSLLLRFLASEAATTAAILEDLDAVYDTSTTSFPKSWRDTVWKCKYSYATLLRDINFDDLFTMGTYTPLKLYTILQRGNLLCETKPIDLKKNFWISTLWRRDIEMVRSSGGGGGSGTPPHLPSLDVDSRSGNGPPAGSASLRGQYHNRVPEISNQPLNTLLPILKDGSLHPEPYYITQNVVWV